MCLTPAWTYGRPTQANAIVLQSSGFLDDSFFQFISFQLFSGVAAANPTMDREGDCRLIERYSRSRRQAFLCFALRFFVGYPPLIGQQRLPIARLVHGRDGFATNDARAFVIRVQVGWVDAERLSMRIVPRSRLARKLTATRVVLVGDLRLIFRSSQTFETCRRRPIGPKTTLVCRQRLQIRMSDSLIDEFGRQIRGALPEGWYRLQSDLHVRPAPAVDRPMRGTCR